MSTLATLEAQFRKQLRSALLRAAKGGSRTIFFLGKHRARSSSRSLLVLAERIMKLYASDTEVPFRQPLAARYMAACLKWTHEHGAKADAVPILAKALLRELELHAN